MIASSTYPDSRSSSHKENISRLPSFFTCEKYSRPTRRYTVEGAPWNLVFSLKKVPAVCRAFSLLPALSDLRMLVMMGEGMNTSRNVSCKIEEIGRSPGLRPGRSTPSGASKGRPCGLGLRLRCRLSLPPSARIGRHKARDTILKREALLQYLGERSDNALWRTLRSSNGILVSKSIYLVPAGIPMQSTSRHACGKISFLRTLPYPKYIR
jgi:hypothetical protein